MCVFPNNSVQHTSGTLKTASTDWILAKKTWLEHLYICKHFVAWNRQQFILQEMLKTAIRNIQFFFIYIPNENNKTLEA